MAHTTRQNRGNLLVVVPGVSRSIPTIPIRIGSFRLGPSWVVQGHGVVSTVGTPTTPPNQTQPNQRQCPQCCHSIWEETTIAAVVWRVPNPCGWTFWGDEKCAVTEKIYGDAHDEEQPSW